MNFFVRRQCIDEEDHGAPVRVGSFHAHTITKYTQRSKDHIVLQQYFQDKFVLISSTSKLKGFIFRVHCFLENVKIRFFTQVLDVTERKTFGNICALELIFIILIRLRAISCQTLTW